MWVLKNVFFFYDFLLMEMSFSVDWVSMVTDHTWKNAESKRVLMHFCFFRTSVYWTSLWLSSFAHNHFFFYTYNQPIRIYCGCFSYLMNSVSNGYNSSELYSEREKLTWTKQYLVTLVRRHTLGVFFCNLCSWSVYVVLIWSHPQPTRTEFGYATASAWLPVALDRRKCVMWNVILFV